MEKRVNQWNRGAFVLMNEEEFCQVIREQVLGFFPSLYLLFTSLDGGVEALSYYSSVG